MFRPSKRLWKHGIHIHLPEVIIDVERVGFIRECVVQELVAENNFFTDALKTTDLNWYDILDDKVYQGSHRGGGLRMIGAPKMTRCKIKHSKGDICPCNRNKGYLIDGAYYWPTWIFKGLSELEKKPHIVDVPTNVTKLFTITRVSSSENTRLTDGWDIDTFTCAPRLSENSGWGKGHATKRKLRQVEPSRDEKEIVRQKV